MFLGSRRTSDDNEIVSIFSVGTSSSSPGVPVCRRNHSVSFTKFCSGCITLYLSRSSAAGASHSVYHSSLQIQKKFLRTGLWKEEKVEDDDGGAGHGPSLSKQIVARTKSVLSFVALNTSIVASFGFSIPPPLLCVLGVVPPSSTHLVLYIFIYVVSLLLKFV